MPALTTLIRWNTPSFPAGYCFTDFNRLFLDAAAFGSFTLNTDAGNSFFNYGDTLPDAANRIFPWLRTVGGYPDDWYVFINGAWLSEYKRAPAQGGDEIGFRMAYPGTETSLLTFDGGENAPVTIAGGPFWEVDHTLDNRTIFAPGTLPSGTPLALGDTGGTDELTIGSANIPPHRHNITIGAAGNNNSDIISDIESGAFRVDSGAQMQFDSTWTSAYVGFTREGGGTGGTPTPVSTMPPYKVFYWIMRTARVYRRVNA